MCIIVFAQLYTLGHKWQLIAQVCSSAAKQYNENIIIIRLYWDSDVSVVTKH